jgi:hypothetical protein
LRPRLEGYRTALRGEAFSAVYVDRAKVLFTVSPTIAGGLADLQALGAYLTIEQMPLLGTSPYGRVYSALETDVSGAFTLSRGRFAVDLELNGVVRCTLKLTNLSIANTLNFYACVQVFGDQRAIDIEDVAAVDNAALPDGLALAQLLDG